MSDNQSADTEVFAQVSDSMKSVIDMTSRIDERVKIIMEKQIEADKRLLTIMEYMNNLAARVAVLESRDGEKLEVIIDQSRTRISELEKQVQILQMNAVNHGERWKNIFSTVVQVATAGAVGWLLYKLGLPAP